MGRSFGLLMVLVVAAIGGFVYMRQVEAVAPGGATPQTTIDTTAVTSDLMAIANAERRYFATNGKYATLDELGTNGDIQIPNRSSYSYAAETTSTGFVVTATYSGPDANAPQQFSIDETMNLSR